MQNPESSTARRSEAEAGIHPCPPFTSFPSVLLCLLLCSCTTPPLHGGRSTVAPSPAGGLAQTLVQSDNPSQPSRQTQDSILSWTYTAPRLVGMPSPASPVNDEKAAHGVSTSSIQHPESSIQYPANVQVREESHATTELGAAQKDTARELTAKLSSLKSIVWFGLALFVFGLASLFWPPLQTIIGSVTTSAAITAGGLALIILPTLVVGNELLILGAVVVAAGGWFLAHRHGHLRGQLIAGDPNRKSKIKNQKSSMALGS